MYSVPKLDDYSPAALDKAVAELRHAFYSEMGDLVSGAFEYRSGKRTAKPDAKPLRDRWLGRKSGILTQVNEIWLRSAPPEAKREVGRRINEIRADLGDLPEVLEAIPNFSTDELRQLFASLEVRDLRRMAGVGTFREPRQTESLDISLPGIRRPLGVEHPITRTMNEIVQVFKDMGYSIAEGPEIETDYYNFESLNFPDNHPARDMADTIFIAGQENKPARDRLLLRTHTSPVQMRTMEQQKPPVRVVAPGRVYRHDTPDATHSPMFHQVEGLAVDTNITFSDLKGTLDHAMKALFGPKMRTRLRPSFFPFTEPSAEVLGTCIFCGGSGFQGTQRCPVCKQTGWIELLGAGMVDPALYGFCAYDPDKVSGFAFGMGADRIAALRYGINDLQLFFQGDVRFLEQFA